MGMAPDFEGQAAALAEQMDVEERGIQHVLQVLQDKYHIEPGELAEKENLMRQSGTTHIVGDRYVITRDLEGGFEIFEHKKAA